MGDQPKALRIVLTLGTQSMTRRIHRMQIISETLSDHNTPGHGTDSTCLALVCHAGAVADHQEIQLAFAAARGGAAGELETLVTAGVPVDQTNEAGDTLLMLAAYHGHLDAVRVLVRLGADANRANDRHQTPIAGAVFKEADDIVTVLLDAGADPFAGQPSAVDTARMFGREGLLALFERNG
jgi:ankyrin repeat protein